MRLQRAEGVRLRECVLLALCALFWAAPSSATSVRLVDLPTLVERADVAVLGWVLSQESFIQDGRILTRSTFEIEETWKGRDLGATLEVITLGGVKDGIGQYVPGSPKLNPGERMALLLARDSRGAYHPVGLWQGVFLVEASSQTPTADVPVRQAPAHSHVVGTRAELPSTLATLRATIMGLAHAR